MINDPIIEDLEHELLREVAILKYQSIEELKIANDDYESFLVRKPAKIIISTLTTLKDEVQCDPFPF